MQNNFTAPEMYFHAVNGYAWVKDLVGWRRISPIKFVTIKQAAKLVYPLYYRSLNLDKPGEITEKTSVVTTDERYWQMATIVIYKGDNINTLKGEQPWQGEPD